MRRYQVMSRGSSRSFSTFTTTFQFVVTFKTGPENSPFIAITFQIFKKRPNKKNVISKNKRSEKKEREKLKPVASHREERRSCKTHPSRRTQMGHQPTRNGIELRMWLEKIKEETSFLPYLGKWRIVFLVRV
jgi:hypothetical protein